MVLYTDFTKSLFRVGFSFELKRNYFFTGAKEMIYVYLENLAQ